jgi:phospholipase/carboxylesterase
MSLSVGFERDEGSNWAVTLASSQTARRTTLCMMSALDELEYRSRPAQGEARGLLVLFHGRGADEHDLFPLLDALDPQRRLLGITPRAPLRLPPGGAHWYVVPRVGYPDPDTFRATYAQGGRWLAALAADAGIPPERTVLGGFSQGAVMSYAFGLGEGRPRPAGVLALSGFIPTVPGFAVDLAAPLPPIAIGHGTLDPVIPVEFGRLAKQTLEEAGATVLYRESPMAHSIDPGFVATLTGWVEDVIV